MLYTVAQHPPFLTVTVEPGLRPVCLGLVDPMTDTSLLRLQQAAGAPLSSPAGSNAIEICRGRGTLVFFYTVLLATFLDV